MLVNQTLWSPNISAASRNLNSVLGFVVHATASGAPALNIAKYFANPDNEVSTHYVIGKDGFCIQCVPLNRVAWAIGASHVAGINNTSTVSAELCNLNDGVDPFPAVQVKKLADVIKAVRRVCPNLPLTRIFEHADTSVQGKSDMRANFPIERLLWYILVPTWVPFPGKAAAYKLFPPWAKHEADLFNT